MNNGKIDLFADMNMEPHENLVPADEDDEDEEDEKPAKKTKSKDKKEKSKDKKGSFEKTISGFFNKVFNEGIDD